MIQTLYYLCLGVVLAPLAASITTGLFGHKIGRTLSHRLAITSVGISFVLSATVLYLLVKHNISMQEYQIYVWANSLASVFEIGFLIDPLTALMMSVVTFVSLMVHIYTIGYMKEDPGYQRFYSYITLFTFSMLMLVMANNFLQLFFGWEAVGVVSYLLIGFWFKRETAVFANLKAFMVNRVGDLGFLLGIAVVYYLFGTLNYMEVFSHLAFMNIDLAIDIAPGFAVNAMTLACILLFVGAMGKSAQVPLHVWLPDSMEGPTPISALIHAATMVTAGVFMVARLSPMFEVSETARSFVIIIGALTAFFMGLVGVVQNDIKRVIAYSTLSQLGYMIVAVGISAYAVGIFHLMTHAFFKALLFLAAGSVIIAMHHVQDMRQMGGLRRYLPITYVTTLIGSLALSGIPPFAGFYSKDMIIDAASFAQLPGASFAYFAVLLSVFVTALYTFRLVFLVFHGQERFDTSQSVKEPGWVVTLPLILLAIPSVIIGAVAIGPLLFSASDFFKQSIVVFPSHDVLAQVAAHYPGLIGFTLHAVETPAFWFAVSGIATAFVCYYLYPRAPQWFASKFSGLYTILMDKYGFDDFNQIVFAGGTRKLSQWCWQAIDVRIIDGIFVNGTAKAWAWGGRVLRRLQTGYLNQYALAMIFGLLLLLSTWLWWS